MFRAGENEVLNLSGRLASRVHHHFEGLPMASKTQADLQAQIDRLRARQRQLAARENKAVRARETKQK